MGRIVWTNRHVQFFGATEMGKTTAAQALLPQRRIEYDDSDWTAGAYNRRIIYDPQGDYEEGKHVQLVVSSFADLKAYTDDVGPRTPFSVALRYSPALDNPKEAALAADVCCEMGWELGDCVVVVEEGHDALSAKADAFAARRLAKAGRHRNVGLWVSGQRLYDANASVRSELIAHEVFVFRVVLGIDLQELARMKDREFADRVSNLEPLHALRLKPGIRDPELWHVDLSTNPPTFGPCTCRVAAAPPAPT